MIEWLKDFLDFGGASITVGKLLWGVVVFLICLIVNKLILRVVKKACKRGRMDSSYTGYIVTVVKIGLNFVAIIIFCDVIGIPISSLLAVLSIAGLALSLAVQDLLSNLISGFVILVTKPFLGGDYIELADKSGTVKSIGFMHTVLLTSDNKTVYIPNHEICISNIINYSREPSRRVDINISVSYDNSTKEVKDSIMAAFAEMGGDIYKDPAPFVGVKEYGSSSVLYSIRVWCDNEKYWDVYYNLNELIRERFGSDNIEMTYDHINVHVVEDKTKK